MAARNDGLTLRQIAPLLGISHQRVARILKNGPPKKIGRPKGSTKKKESTT